MSHLTQPVLRSRAAVAPADTHAAQHITPRLYHYGLVLALMLGAFVRLFPVLTADFPLNDGGLFFTMSEDIQRAGYALPEYTSYNQSQLPFAYSPLAFYLTAALGDVTSLDLVVIVRILPAVLSALTLGAFYLLARELLHSDLQVILATFAFAFLPRSFEWLIMGGGLTRALGMLCLLLTVWQAVLLYQGGSKRHIVWCAWWGGLTVLSHPGIAWFAAFSCAIMFLFFGRTRKAVVHSLLVATGVILIVLPWVITIIERHNASTFLAAGGSASSYPLWLVTLNNLIMLSGEPGVQILLIVGLLGVAAIIAQRQYLLPAWLAAIMLLDPRSAPTDASIPLAMLVAVGVDQVLLPGVTALIAKLNTTKTSPSGASKRLSHAVLGLLLLYGFATATISANPVLHPRTALRPIAAADRAAMQWIAQAPEETIPPESQFLVLTSADFWQIDAVIEWFPSLARHKSITTVQGHEWLPDDQFADLQIQYNLSRHCIPEGVECLEDWARKSDTAFTHLYLSKSPRGNDESERYFAALEAELAANPAYKLIYSVPDVSIYTVR